jgi:phage shock protein B
MQPEFVIGLVAILSIFVFLPWMVFHHITIWRKQKTLQPDNERIMEDLWHSAKRMERRIETLEALIQNEGETRAPRSQRDQDYRRDQ